MRILLLGGTQFIGRHIALNLLAAGHTVTIFNRGLSPDDLPSQVERLRGDRDEGMAGLRALTGRTWDACIDVSGYTPRQVRPSAEMLHPNVHHYLYISAVSVYGDPTDRPVRETHPTLPPAAEDVTEVVGETYGALKVACENIVSEVYGERCTILRPQSVIGPYDPSDRYTYWVARSARGGEMLAPGDGSDHLQVIDVHDLTRFIQRVTEQQIMGVFNLAGPRITWSEFMHFLDASNLVWVPAGLLRSVESPYMDFPPLFRSEHGFRSGLMDIDTTLAQAAGLTLTDPTDTIKTMRAWIQGRELPLSLSPEREAELINLTRQG